MIEYFNRYRVRKKEEPQDVELDESGKAKYTPEFTENEVFVFGSYFAN